MLIAASMQDANHYTDASPGLIEYSTMWDARWYRLIAESGYPEVLPVGPDGELTDNAWAFMPVYPMLLRLAVLIGVPWDVAGVAISLLASAAFAVVAYRLFLDVARDFAPWALALVFASPVSPVFQIAYAESLGLLLLAAALLAWRREQWFVLSALLPLMALTRPLGLAFSFAIVIVMAIRWWRALDEPWPIVERVRLFALAIWAGVCGIAWLVICGWTVGQWDAYLETELVWRSAYIGRTELVPFTSWIVGFDWWFGGAGPILLAVVVGMFVMLIAGRARSTMGIEAWAFVVAYGAYLLAVWFPQTSTFRLLMPMFPLALVAVSLVVPRAWRVAMILVSIGLQFAWLMLGWQIIGRDWTVP